MALSESSRAARTLIGDFARRYPGEAARAIERLPGATAARWLEAVPGPQVAGVLDASNLQAFAQYNILPRRVTPFVRGSFGWTWIDSNIPAGPAQGACWWDPWWGYVCDTWQSTYEDTSFAYGAAAGVRAELARTAFLEGSYNLLWIDLDRAGSQSFDGFRLNVGWMF